MRLATIRTDAGHATVRLEGTAAIEIADSDLGTLLGHDDWQTRADRACPGRATTLRRSTSLPSCLARTRSSASG